MQTWRRCVCYGVCAGNDESAPGARLCRNLAAMQVLELSPFWAASGPSDDADFLRDVVEVSFVDDAAFALLASTPKALLKAIRMLLDTLIRVFTQFGLVLNFEKGKTECIVVLRGKHSSRVAEAIRGKAGFEFSLPAPYEKQTLRAVQQYKHLGTHATCTGTYVVDAAHRASVSMQAYTPLAGKVFSSPHIPARLKVILMMYLILSRLLYNTHIWTPCARALGRLNTAYMRVVRRIFGEPRFGKTEHDDATVRALLGVPSIDCLLQRRRLLYLGRLMRAPLSTIHAVLALTHKGACLPWIRLVQKDLSDMHTRVPEMASGFPPPLTAPHAWSSLMRDAKAWHEAVCKIRFSDSVLDDKQAPAISVQLAHTCEDCTKCFATRQALLQHKRIAHSWRDPILKFIDGSGKCPVCGTFFVSRLRMLAHVTDSRRDRCRKQILGGHFQIQTDKQLALLEAADGQARKDARRQGRSHAIAQGSARLPCGARIGHVNN